MFSGMQILELDGHVLRRIERDDAVDEVTAGVSVDGLHHGIDDQPHVEFCDILAIDFLDQPCSVHRVQVVALEHGDDNAFGIHQVQILGIVLCRQCVTAHISQGMHDGFLAGDIFARVVGCDELAEHQVVAAQLERAVDGIAAVVAIDLVAPGKIQVQVGALYGVHLLLAHGDDVPFTIELLGSIGDLQFMYGLFDIGISVLDTYRFFVVFIVFFLAGIHCVRDQQHGQQEQKDDIFSHFLIRVFSFKLQN